MASQHQPLLHPFLIGLYPIAALYVENSTATPWRALASPVLFVLVLCAVVVLLFRYFLGNRSKSYVAASWTIACFFSYRILFYVLNFSYGILVSSNSRLGNEFVLPIWLVIWGGGVLFLALSSKQFDQLNRFLGVLGWGLCLLPCLAMNGSWLSLSGTPPKELQAWRPQRLELIPLQAPPDIYFLVFDRYAGEQSLKQFFGVDNSGFLSELRHRGFAVSQESYANYPRTILSMASALNICLLPQEIKSDLYYSQMLQNHTVGLSLKKVGYKYHHFGNWYQPLRTNRNADYVLATSFLPSEFSESLYEMTPLSKLWRAMDKYSYVKKKLAEVAQVAKTDGPNFVYAHFLLPHTPYVFDHDGSKREWMTARYSNAKDSYRRQLEATNRFIIELTDQILRDSKRPPLICLIADEGPYLCAEDGQLSYEEKVFKRTSILNAYYLPPLETITEKPVIQSPVNVFRTIFNLYFGVNLSSLPDTVHYWSQDDSRGRPAKSNRRYVDVTNLVKTRSVVPSK